MDEFKVAWQYGSVPVAGINNMIQQAALQPHSEVDPYRKCHVPKPQLRNGYRHSIGPWTSTITVKYVRKKHTQRLALIFGTESTNTKLKSAVTFSDKMSRKIAKMQTHIHTHTPLNSVKGHLVLAVKCYSKESKWQEQEHNQTWPLTRTITSMDRNYFDTE